MAQGLQEGAAPGDLAEITPPATGSDPGAQLSELPETEASAVNGPPSIYDRVTYSRPSAELPPLLERPEPRRSRQAGAVVVAAVAVAAVLALIFYPTTNDKYIRDLKNAGLLVQYPSHDAAVTAGKTFCSNLNEGAHAQGTPAQLIAVQHYCPVYESGFTVLPAGPLAVSTAPKKVSTPVHHKAEK